MKKNTTDSSTEYVVATLPNGEEVELHGDAVEIAKTPGEKPKSDRDRVLQAIQELLHNPETPQGLYEAVAQFLCEQLNRCGDNLYHSTAMIIEVLKTVPPDDTRGAVLAARAKGEGGETARLHDEF